MSLIWIDKKRDLLIVYKDVFGKRSLTITVQDDLVVIGSASFGGNATEISSDSMLIFKLS